MKHIKRCLKKCIAPLLVASVGFILSGKPINVMILLAVIIAFTAIECYEYYFDKKNDIKKFFIFHNEETYIGLSSLLWAGVLFIAWYLYPTSKSQSFVLVALPILSILFSFSRKKIYLPNQLIGFQWAVLPLFGVDFWHIETPWPFVFSAATFFIVLGRSIMEDLEDKYAYRKEYKVTLLSTGVAEKEILKRTSRLISFGLFLGLPLFYFLGFTISMFVFLSGFVIFAFLCVSLFYFSERYLPVQKQILDIVVLTMLVSFVLFRFF